MIFKTIAGAVIGGVIGYALHRLVGCPTGGCPITANPYISTVYGMVVGTIMSVM